MELQNTGGLSRADFKAARDKLLAAARADSMLQAVRPTDLQDQPTLKVDVDPQKLSTLGLSQADVNSTLSTAWGGRYVNDFNDRGRVKRVYVQGDAPYRASPDDIAAWYVRGSSGDDGALLVLRQCHLGHGALLAQPVRRLLVLRTAGPGGAGHQLGPGDGADGGTCRTIARHQRGLGRPVLSGTAVLGPGTLSLCAVAAGRVPVPRGAVRELDDPDRGAVGHPIGAGRRGVCGDLARPRE